MRAHTPPFTKPEAAYDSRRLTAREAYDQTSAIAAEQDARHAMTDAERESKLRTVAHYIYHAKLLMDEVFGTERARSKQLLGELAQESQKWGLYPNADTPTKSPHDDFIIVQDPPDLPLGWLARGGVPVESAYLASFGPNDDMSKKSPKADTRVASVDEVAGLREHLTAEQLREYDIGDVPHRPNARNAHPMAAEALRDHDERLNGPEDSL